MAVFPPVNPPVIPTPDSVLSGLKNTKSTIAFCVPTFIEVSMKSTTSFADTDFVLQTWSHDPETVEFLAKMRYILFGGAPLTQSVRYFCPIPSSKALTTCRLAMILQREGSA